MFEVGDIIDSREAARTLGLHEETLRRLTREGKIPSFKVGKKWRYNRRTLYAWSEAQHQMSDARCVLVVDDDADIREIAARVIRKEGFGVAKAAGGAEALEMLRRNGADLVLLDLVMPGMDGPDVLRNIREGHGDLPVVIITGHPESHLVARAMAFGPITLLLKPLDQKHLAATVRMILDGASSLIRKSPATARPARNQESRI